MKVFLLSIKWRSVRMFLEYIIFLKTSLDLMFYLKQVSRLPRNSGVEPKLKKHPMFAEKNGLPRDPIYPSRIEILNTTTYSITELKDGNNRLQIRFCLEICRLFDRFVRNVRGIAASLILKLLKNELTLSQTLLVPEKYAVEQQNFLLNNPPVPALPQVEGHLKIDTDARNTQLWWVLLQKLQYGTRCPIW